MGSGFIVKGRLTGVESLHLVYLLGPQKLDSVGSLHPPV